MVYGFVRQSGGHIKIDSKVGQGTTINLYLPRSLQSEETLVDIDAMPVVGGSEMVLVAEDDEAVRETVVALLNDLGYRVLKARDAQSALSIIESGMPIDLLFTDVVMPGTLKSTELARKARERIPHLAVLFTSGYSQDAITNAGRLDENVELLSKPYSRDALARKLRHVLANATQRKIMQANFGTALLTAKHLPKKLLSVLICEDDPIDPVQHDRVGPAHGAPGHSRRRRADRAFHSRDQAHRHPPDRCRAARHVRRAAGRAGVAAEPRTIRHIRVRAGRRFRRSIGQRSDQAPEALYSGRAGRGDHFGSAEKSRGF